jgi:hypothetical protein
LPELCCLEPSSLNRPHPPHSWAHRDFAARRLIRDVFAVRERRSDPRVVPSFRCTFLPDMPPSPTPGSSVIVSSKFTMPTWSSPWEHWLDTPNIPTIRFTWGVHFVATLVRNCYGLPGCSPPWTDLTGIRVQPQEAFTSRLSTERSPLPSLDITTTSIGLLCRRDFHPLEWQLASLHVPTERSVRIYRTTLFGRCFTALQEPATPRMGGAALVSVTASLL